MSFFRHSVDDNTTYILQLSAIHENRKESLVTDRNAIETETKVKGTSNFSQAVLSISKLRR